MKRYQLRNHDKNIARKKICSNNRHKTDNNFCLIGKQEVEFVML